MEAQSLEKLLAVDPMLALLEHRIDSFLLPLRRIIVFIEQPFHPNHHKGQKLGFSIACT